ncbi:MAG TPA: hypothetical protein H9671_04070 [Firmicutes bacterium]|nr:hypothetical protein [Bacillota bacterium]
MTKETLKNYRVYAMEIRQIKAEIHRLRSKIFSIKSEPDSDLQKTGDQPGAMSEELYRNTAIQLEELIQKYYIILNQLCAEQLRIETAIASLPSEERQIFRWRYLHGMSWIQISVKAGYSKAQIYRVHANILKKLQNFE